ncbi:MAG: SDR family oxidoreductase [Acidobacteria bacterium]|nr:SDR family oxidoreductase [Acidobacteriota bacterium]
MGHTEDAEALRGKVVLVTGSARGLGATLVRAMAEQRARVVINCRENKRAAEALALDVCKGGTEALVCRADVTEPEEARSLVDETVKAFGRVDVLVNTVGSFTWKPVGEMDPAEWRTVMASNLDSVYHMCRLALPHMRRSHWGRVINIGAVGAERALGQPKVSAYSAAKAAVIAFSRALALEEARCGITVNVVSPGFLVDGEVRAPSPDPGGDRVPVGRSGAPEDVVRAVLFFASPAADFVTGQVLAVAGGWRL